ncbi:response regulator transcription factor [Lentibacter sp.]|uniref:response regulator transcription factor n=1 Tax=Lentibacter sp. TaxID=2024994 RepID=UPI003F6AAB0B
MGRTVVLVEDEPNIIEAISFILSRDGWTVHTHSNGDTAMAALELRAPDLIVLDVMLPGRSGFDILSDIRGHAVLGQTPVMMLTARGQTKDRDRAMELGASRFMTKPFSNSEVLDAVRELASS